MLVVINRGGIEVDSPMVPKINEAIEKAVSQGIPPQYIAYGLIQAGWPPSLVNQAITNWMTIHGQIKRRTDFKKWLRKYKQKAFPATILLVFLGTVNAAVMLLKPWPTKIMVDSAFGTIPAPGPLEPYTHTPTLILLTSLMTLGIFVVGAIFETVKDYFMVRLGFWLNRSIKTESFRHILHLPMYHQERLAKGDYIYRQNVVTNSLSELVLGTTISIVQSIIMILGLLVILFHINSKLTVIAIVVIPFLFFFIKLIGPWLGKVARELSELNSKISSVVTEAVENAETVQAYTLEEERTARADSLWRESYKLNKKGALLSQLLQSSNGLVVILGTSTVMYFGGTAALNGQMSLGQLIIFMAYMGFLLQPVEVLAAQWAARGQKMIDVNRVYQVLSDHEGIENLRGDSRFPKLQSQIEFQGISYTYNDIPVLKNINLKIAPKEKVAIIGPSGSGKSTLLKLLPLFIEPTNGRILVDNIDIQTVSLKELRQRIGWISQSPQLFSDTILNNLRLGDINREISDQELVDALVASNSSEFVINLPLGVDSPSGEDGAKLSGGQRQRLAIARGLLKKSPILCMDEPTAALDSKSERVVRDSIGKLIKDKTVLLVTHRKSLLSLMDTIYVMEDGQLTNVRKMGGLDAYLKQIGDKDDGVAPAFTEVEERRIENERFRLAALERENIALQEQVDSNTDKRSSPPGDGTFYITH